MTSSHGQEKATPAAKPPKAQQRPLRRAGRSADTPAAPGQTSVRVRMYRQGLGDCFLLRSRRTEDRGRPRFHVLIDCGDHPRHARRPTAS